MNERQKEQWAGMLLGVMVVAILLGGWLVLRLTVHEGLAGVPRVRR